MQKLTYLILLILLVSCSSSSNMNRVNSNKKSDLNFEYSAVISNPIEKIKKIDGLFIATKSMKQSIPQSTVQHWIRLQIGFAELHKIIEDPKIDSQIKSFANYVAAYGYFIIGLYDIAEEYQRKALRDIKDTNKHLNRTQIMTDLANSLEFQSRYGEAIKISEEVLKSNNSPTNLNNLSLRYLKNGDYDKAIETIEKIELDKSTSHTRVFSARAYAYSKRYTKAEGELKKAYVLNDQMASTIETQLKKSASPEEFWKMDKSIRESYWTTSSMIKDSHLNKITDSSKYSVPFWFNEIFNHYDEDYNLKTPGQISGIKYAFTLMNGVPMLNVDCNLNQITEILKKVHHPSAWDAAVEIEYTALKVDLDNQNNYLVILTPWQKQMVLNY